MRRVVIAVVAVLLTVVFFPDTASGASDRVRFEAPAGESLLVHGTYPPVESSCVDPTQPLLHARFRGTIEVGRTSDGSLFVIGELPFEDYLKGIAEVPRNWPMEALRAQVVAARTYALSQLPLHTSGEETLGYDLCATTACQVYTGMGVEAGPWGERWIRAVETTRGEALLQNGSPATTFYFSTSNGRTYPNESIFGGNPLPYLRGTSDRDDRESPLARWTVTVPFGELARFLGEAGRWGGGSIERVEADGDVIRFRGASSADLTRAELRSALNGVAHCREPDRYPQSEPGGYRLPQTVPSIWFRVRTEDRRLVLEGRGWGHGVGMVQWGAKGKADRGLRYDEILAAYYGGLTPERIDTPATIRVLVAEGLRTVTVVPSGDVDVRSDGRAPRPPWRLSGFERLRLRHGNEPGPVLEMTRFRPARRATLGGTYRARIELSAGATVRLVFEKSGVVLAAREHPFDRGRHVLRTEAPGLPPGPYRVRAVADDGVDRVTTRRAAVLFEAGPSPGPTLSPARSPIVAAPSDDPGEGFRIAILLVAVALLFVILMLFALRRARGLHRAR